MDCPYCLSPVSEAAHVCKTCGRDLYLLKPLLEKIAALEVEAAKVPELEAQLAKLRVEDRPQQGSEILLTEPAERSVGWFRGLGLGFVLPLACLLLAHWLIIIQFDLNPLYLRIAALLLPLPFALFLAKRGLGLWAGFVLGGFLAVSAVFGMSALTGAVDGTPVLPQNALEWREFVEFSASVAFSFLTGLLLVQRRLALSKMPNTQGVIVYLAGHLNIGGLTLPEKIERLNELWGKVVAAATTVISVYTGLKDFVGL